LVVKKYHQIPKPVNGTAMRITDDRYTRDRLRLDLALRLIRHEARTCTIRSWTGLTDDRIRKLYKSYVLHAGARTVRRHRGKAPRRPAYFLRNSDMRTQSSTLATLLCSLGLLEPDARTGAGALEQLRWGERFCEAYEAYLAEHGQAFLGFEHACFLQRALERQAELAIDECGACGSLVVVAAYAARLEGCVFCSELRRPTRPAAA
jgi:hypothetical protein